MKKTIFKLVIAELDKIKMKTCSLLMFNIGSASSLKKTKLFIVLNVLIKFLKLYLLPSLRLSLGRNNATEMITFCV